MTTEKPETVYDFGGFPSILYTLEYPAPGHPALAQHAADLLQAAGWDTATVSAQGLDHGAWVPLLHLLPDAQIPVFQVSMPLDLTTVSALALGRALAPLREQGVLIVASGSMTHNLHEFRQRATVAEPYVLEFSNWVNAAVKANSITAMTRYRSEAPHAQRAHPSEEHFLPLLVALGAQEGGNGSGSGSGDVLQAIDGGVTHGMLSMDSFVWGMPG